MGVFHNLNIYFLMIGICVTSHITFTGTYWELSPGQALVIKR